MTISNNTLGNSQLLNETVKKISRMLKEAKDIEKNVQYLEDSNSKILDYFTTVISGVELINLSHSLEEAKKHSNGISDILAKVLTILRGE